MSYETAVIYKDGQLIAAHAMLQEEWQYNLKEGETYVIQMKIAKPKKFRTLMQNSSIHLYLTKIANALNAAGWDMRRTLKPEVDIPWTLQNAKEYLWRPIQNAVTNKKSTTDLETHEVSEVFNVLSKHLAEKTGVVEHFPSRHTQGYD